MFDIVEQTTRPQSAIAIGSKVAASDLCDRGVQVDVHFKRNPSQDHLRAGYGTITSLGKDGDGRMYAITNKHCLEDKPRPGDAEPPTILSVVEGNVVSLGDHYIGHKGVIQRNIDGSVRILNNTEAQHEPDKNSAVDIAAVLLSDDVADRLDPDLQLTLGPCAEDIHQLVNQRVFKIGATSATTSGTIHNTRYTLYEQGLVSGEHILIVPSSDRQEARFARAGDSGSLVWGSNNKLVGILEKTWTAHSIGGRLRNTTFAIGLKTNLDALKECGVEISNLIAYGAQLPVAEPESMEVET